MHYLIKHFEKFIFCRHIFSKYTYWIYNLTYINDQNFYVVWNMNKFFYVTGMHSIIFIIENEKIITFIGGSGNKNLDTFYRWYLVRYIMEFSGIWENLIIPTTFINDEFFYKLFLTQEHKFSSSGFWQIYTFWGRIRKNTKLAGCLDVR